MSRMFGWDLPPGCTTHDIERAIGGRDPFPEEDAALEILETAGVATDVNDKIVEIIGKLCESIAAQKAQLDYIATLPVHPADDARNQAALERAKAFARGDLS